MGRKRKNVLDTFFGFCRSFVFRPKPEPKKNVSKVYSKTQQAYSPEKQKKLEAMCEQLFDQKELLTTGKLQLLGLSKIKRKLGKTWAGLQPIVYKEVEEAIAKYMMPKDLFIRYKDDSYVIIFAEAGPEESQIKARLIAEEIKRRLFEHEEEELNNIEVEESVSVFATRDLKKGKNLDETMDIIFQDRKETEVPKKTKPKQKVEISATIEIDPYADTQEVVSAEKKKEAAKRKSLNCTYAPLWDVNKNLLTTYLCLAQGSCMGEDPFDNHELLFLGAPPSLKAEQDLRILKTVAQDLKEIVEGQRKLFIACPVHYETLTRAESYERYILECQKIPDLHKKYLVFMLLNLPEQFHESNIQKFSVPLKKHCSAIFAQVPLNTNIDFALIRECRFDALGVRLKKSATGSEKNVIDKLGLFSQKAKKALIGKVFVLDVTSLSVTTSAVCAGVDYLGGAAIHECVEKPNSIYRFMHQDLFANLLSEE